MPDREYNINALFSLLYILSIPPSDTDNKAGYILPKVIYDDNV